MPVLSMIVVLFVDFAFALAIKPSALFLSLNYFKHEINTLFHCVNRYVFVS